MNQLINTLVSLLLFSTMRIFVLFLVLFNKQIKEYWDNFKKELDK